MPDPEPASAESPTPNDVKQGGRRSPGSPYGRKGFGLRPMGLPVIALAVMVLADVLFFRQWVGWTLGGFSAVLVMLLLARHARGLARRSSFFRVWVWAVLLLALAGAMAIEPGPLAFILLVAGLGGLVLEARDGGRTLRLGWGWLGRLGLLWLTLWARPVLDSRLVQRWLSRRKTGWAAKGAALFRLLFLVAGVVVPLLLGLVFLGLFASANPVIARWLGDGFEEVGEFLLNVTDYLTAGRLLLWAVTGLGVWGLLRYRGMRRPRACRGSAAGTGKGSPIYLTQSNPWGGRVAVPQPTAESAATPALRTGPDGVAWADWLVGQAVRLTVKTLVVLNAVFLVQLLLDARYLMLGAALPEGMTYAEYAHRGAYPLIVTALLAGAMVLAVFRPGGPAERSTWARGLVLLWIAQNAVLVGTAAWRLGLYVEVYSMTRLRAAAAVWMLMVVGGLVLLIWRIALRRDNRWLTGRTMGWGLAVLFVCCFVPFDPLIAAYNVDRCREMASARAVDVSDDAHQPVGQPIDVDYLATLGPDALPAIDRLLAEVPAEVLDRPTPLRRPATRSVASTRGQYVPPGDDAVPVGPTLRERLVAARRVARGELDGRLSGWRGWTVRRAWLDGVSQPIAP